MDTVPNLCYAIVYAVHKRWVLTRQSIKKTVPRDLTGDAGTAPFSPFLSSGKKSMVFPILSFSRQPAIPAAGPKEALNKSWRMRGSRIGMGCKADFAANSWLLARNSTQQTARARLIARRKGLVQRFPKEQCA